MTDDKTIPLGKRTPKGLLIRPRQQFKYAFILVAGGIIAQSMVIGLMAYFINNTVFSVINAHQLAPEIATIITRSINISLSFLILLALAFSLVAVLIGVKLSHRIYGTLVPFSRHIQLLREGQYAARMNLRKNDDMVELKDALNSLAETLEARYPNDAARAKASSR